MQRGQFDFEKLIVYQKSLDFYSIVRTFKLSTSIEDKIAARQLFRASLSISLNIAEGTGKTSLEDRRNFFVISRGSVFECAAIILALERTSNLPSDRLDKAYQLATELGKMLTTLIHQLDKKLQILDTLH